MITSGAFSRGAHRCPVCQQPGYSCGDSHTGGPVDNTAPRGVFMTEPQQLREYTYTVNNMVTTALLTEEMAKRLGARPTGDSDEEKNGGFTSAKNARVYGSTHMGAAVEGGEAVKPAREQQQGIDAKGRTASMRAGTDDEDDADEREQDTEQSNEELPPVGPSAPNKTRRPRDK